MMGMGGVNRANNLFFIFLGAMLAAIAVSGFGSAGVLRNRELEVARPENAFAGRSLIARIRLLNPRRWMPAFSVKVSGPTKKQKARKSWRWARSEFVFPKDRKWIRLRDYTLRYKADAAQGPDIFTEPVYFTFVPARTSAEAQVPLQFPRRGLYTQKIFSVSTRFPFSFLTTSRRVNLERELIVYPALLEAGDFLDILPMITGEFVSYVQCRGADLYRIREHAPEDPARFVDWKATAKTGTLKVREFTREDERRLRLVFDNPAPGTVADAAYEHAVSMTTSLAWHFAGENVELAFVAPSYQGDSYLYNFLKYLALIEPAEGASVLDALPVSADYNVIITARKPGTLPTTLWASSYVIYM